MQFGETTNSVCVCVGGGGGGVRASDVCDLFSQLVEANFSLFLECTYVCVCVCVCVCVYVCVCVCVCVCVVCASLSLCYSGKRQAWYQKRKTRQKIGTSTYMGLSY